MGGGQAGSGDTVGILPAESAQHFLLFSATSVKFFFQVRPLVCDEVGAIAEALAAFRASVRLLSRVNALVYDEN